MSERPDPLKIYHITHAKNVKGILADGSLWSDAKRIERKCATELVGMSKIKQRRLTELAVPCHKGTLVGQYVPFYFCPRSIMLYILSKGNHPDITYSGGQRPILHLQADLTKVVHWAKKKRVHWAFSNRNAGARYCQFYHSLDKLDEIDWGAVATTNFGDQAVKDGKQAEFLIFESLPWELVESIGVLDGKMAERVEELISEAEHKPAVTVKRDWYF